MANALGFLSQSHEATTGLIGTLSLALARIGDLQDAVVRDRDLLRPVLEVLRYDPPIQNTRRFVADDGVVGAWP